jgi:hypothetical protein
MHLLLIWLPLLCNHNGEAWNSGSIIWLKNLHFGLSQLVVPTQVSFSSLEVCGSYISHSTGHIVEYGTLLLEAALGKCNSSLSLCCKTLFHLHACKMLFSLLWWQFVISIYLLRVFVSSLFLDCPIFFDWHLVLCQLRTELQWFQVLLLLCPFIFKHIHLSSPNPSNATILSSTLCLMCLTLCFWISLAFISHGIFNSVSSALGSLKKFLTTHFHLLLQTLVSNIFPSHFWFH